MIAISENLFCRGKSKTFYCRRRIPAAILAAYPTGKLEINVSLRTRDRVEAQKRLRLELVRMDAEFEQHARDLKEVQDMGTLRHVKSLTDDHLQCLAQFWVRAVLLTDAHLRSKGMDEEEFAERGQSLTQQREELGKMLARGQVKQILPAMHSFIHLCGLQVDMTPEQAQQAGYRFLEAVVTALDHQITRQSGKRIDIDGVAPEVIHPAKFGIDAPTGPSWNIVFDTWKNYVEDRPKATVISNQTPWGQLELFAAARNITEPGHVTPEHISEFVQQMETSGLKIKTINGRLGKLKEIFKVAVGKRVLPSNPAEKTLGYKESAKQKGEKRRLPFTLSEINVIFGSPVFTQHLRSSGQAGEASYWIPLIMFYTGARPEEVAGLELLDIQHDQSVGWYFHISDFDDSGDCDLFDETEPLNNIARTSEKRRLKNHVSRRRVPVSKELINLGLLRYVDWLRSKGATVLFPTLKQDFHGKLSGAFSKWFGRYKRELGFTSEKKVLYSLRHNMKDFLEKAQVPSKYLKRILGHASGDGTITDNYGSDVPLDVIYEHFSKVCFPIIPAKAWQPGAGYIRKNSAVISD